MQDAETLTLKGRNFIRFHKGNPHIYVLIERYAFELIEAGVCKCSIWLIINRIRWDQAVRTRSTDGFKISNDQTTFYSRLFLHYHPEHEGFFDTNRSPEDENMDLVFSVIDDTSYPGRERAFVARKNSKRRKVRKR